MPPKVAVADNCKIRIGSLNSSSSDAVTWLMAIKSTAFSSLMLYNS